eukprot:scaffold2409_cov360-Pinguiococcus_pyrenoidosus.AAC.2
MAGADAVIMSLWPVHDRATQRLMELFYEAWLTLEDGDDEEPILRVKCSVAEAWTQTIRTWLTIQADPEYHVRKQVYMLLGLDASTGDEKSKDELFDVCYNLFTEQEADSALAKSLKEVMNDLSIADLSHEKSKYYHPLFWAAFSVVAV